MSTFNDGATFYDGPTDRLLVAHHRRAKAIVARARKGTIRERPLCRKAIIAEGLSPFIFNGCWTGYGCDPVTGMLDLSDGLKLQMAIMIAEGCYGDVGI